MWDIGNGLGLLSFAGLFYLFIEVGQGARQRVHQLISYGVAGCALLHVLWLWIPDATLWHYMLWDAPYYMLAGWLSLLALAGTILIALPGARRFWYAGFVSFRRWHYWLSLSVVVTAWWHMTGSGFYISATEAALYALLFAALWQRQRLSKAS